jgi:glycogen debranching enzyme
VAILGAGIGIGNGGDYFEWMDSWQVYSKTRDAHAGGEIDIADLRGDALLVEKSEAASALIYWNGKRYVWPQQGD